MINRIIHKEKRPYRKVRTYCFGKLKYYISDNTIVLVRQKTPIASINRVSKNIIFEDSEIYNSKKVNRYKLLYAEHFRLILKFILKDDYKLIGSFGDYNILSRTKF